MLNWFNPPPSVPIQILLLSSHRMESTRGIAKAVIVTRNLRKSGKFFYQLKAKSLHHCSRCLPTYFRYRLCTMHRLNYCSGFEDPVGLLTIVVNLFCSLSNTLIPPFSVPIHKLPDASSANESTSLWARLLLLRGFFFKVMKCLSAGIIPGNTASQSAHPYGTCLVFIHGPYPTGL